MYVSVCIVFEFGEVWVEYQNLVLDSKATRSLQTKKTLLKDFFQEKLTVLKLLGIFEIYTTSKLENNAQFFIFIYIFFYCFKSSPPTSCWAVHDKSWIQWTNKTL